MKINYEKITYNLKSSLFLLGDNFKNQQIKNKIKNIIVEIEDIVKKEKKKKKEEKANIYFNSKNPKKSIELIDKLIEEEQYNGKLDDNK